MTKRRPTKNDRLLAGLPADVAQRLVNVMATMSASVTTREALARLGAQCGVAPVKLAPRRGLAKILG